MSDKLQFRVSAELKNILGRDLITSPDIAILELVKNSYDAHAKKVEIIFERGRLVIADNGKGMSYDDLINKWLFVAYSAKRDGSEDESYRDKFKHHFAGAKGIGRLSCDCLARYLTLVTKSVDGNTEKLVVDWADFERDDKEEFDKVKVTHETLNFTPRFPNDKETGTILTFSGLHFEWSRNSILDLKRSLEKMINPFSEVDDFQIELIAPNEREADQASNRSGIVNGIIENSIAAVLNIKTTQIDARISEGKIITTLMDRGVKMYEIEETPDYHYLDNSHIVLYFLNRAAKTSFSRRMGISPVQYGNVFLFRNGFRILPYGEHNDDSWGLNRRAQQGFRRFLSTRELFGRVDVETDNPADFKEVSSRDGGLIQTPAYYELFSFFNKTFLRLERYVVGVLWGGNFLQKEYFRDRSIAESVRAQLRSDKDSENPDSLYTNLGSQVDFLQLVKNLVNDPTVKVNYFDSSLANIIADVSVVDLVQDQIFQDLKKVAEESNNLSIIDQFQVFEKQLENLKKKRIEAEARARAAEEEAERERKSREEETKRREQAESELENRKKQNLFLQSIGTLDKERIIHYHHDIRLQALTVQNSLSEIAQQVSRDRIDIRKLRKDVELISRANDRILSISQFATKANFNSAMNVIEADIVAFIQDYMDHVLEDLFGGNISLKCDTNDCFSIRRFKPLEVTLIIDNLLSNSLKVHATVFYVGFSMRDEKLVIEVVDDGPGLSPEIKNPQDVFEIGITTTNGSGLGLYNVSKFVREEMHGTVEVDPDFCYSSSNKGFKIRIVL